MKTKEYQIERVVEALESIAKSLDKKKDMDLPLVITKSDKNIEKIKSKLGLSKKSTILGILNKLEKLMTGPENPVNKDITDKFISSVSGPGNIKLTDIAKHICVLAGEYHKLMNHDLYGFSNEKDCELAILRHNSLVGDLNNIALFLGKTKWKKGGYSFGD